MMEGDTSRMALKIVLILSILLVTMDLFEIYYSFVHMKSSSNKLNTHVFEGCVKYHILSQIFFTVFATFAGLSACLMSLGLLIDYDFFSFKVIDTFLYWNYIIFGPYLLATCMLGYFNFKRVVFNCDPHNLDARYINFSTLMALFICLFLSLIITFAFTIIQNFKILIQSIRFRPDGNRVLGRLFWDYVLNRGGENNGNLRNDEEPSEITN